jgi:hypothetical protein
MNDAGLEGACDGADACKIPANYPCPSEAGDFLSCFLDNIELLCTTASGGDHNGNGNGDAPQPQQSTSPCLDSLHKLQQCGEAHGLTGTDTGSSGTDDNPPTDTCTMAQGCNCGNDSCKSCKCALGENSDTCAAVCM